MSYRSPFKMKANILMRRTETSPNPLDLNELVVVFVVGDALNSVVCFQMRYE